MIDERVQAALEQEDLEALGELLVDELAVVRLAAAEALVELGSSEAHDVLYGALSHPDSLFRIELVRRLGRRQDAFTVARVERALKDSDPFVRTEALSVLAKLGSARSLEALAGQLSDPLSAIRQRTVEALARVGVRSAEFLIAAFEDREERVRRAAVQALCELPDEGACFLVCVEKPDSLRQQARARLLNMTEPAAIIAAMQEAQEELARSLAANLPLEECLQLADTGNRAAMEQLQQAEAAERHAAIEAMMRGEETERAMAAARIAYRFEGAEALLPYAQGPMRSLVTRVLLESEDPRGPELLRADLADASGDLRRTALLTAVQVGVCGVEDILTAAVTDPSVEVRRIAVSQLARRDREEFLPVLRRAAADRDLQVCIHAVEALASRGEADRSLLPAYCRTLNAARLNSERKLEVALLLGQPGANLGVSSLKRAVRTREAPVRRASAEALARIGSEAALQALASLQDTKDSRVLRVVAFALDGAGDPRALLPLIRVSEECRGSAANRARRRVEGDTRWPIPSA